MQVDLLTTAQIDRNWDAIVEMLAPALKHDPEFDTDGLYGRLMDRSTLLFHGSEGAEGLLVVSVDDEGGDLIASTIAIAGRFTGGPKQRLSLMRQGIRAIEDVARIAGCKAHRICGRDYSRFFPDYRRFEGARNGLEKRL
ncbi:hypothetical protein ACFOOL_14930 [Devosia honganensis]|uniref:GNAT family N-acetyltransferase n=1 Tax=Devosia honganensis TaxID=1610527 RepID=A0ABV7X7M9_9HYPH